MKDEDMTPCTAVAIFCGAAVAVGLFVVGIGYWLVTTL